MPPFRAQNTRLDTKGWHARLDLLLENVQARTALTHTRRTGPLAVQRPFYPEGDVCHIYLLHPPGGLVGGDRLELNLQLKKGTHGFFTTPGATKFYRSANQPAIQDQSMSVDTGGILEWFPQETIIFPQAAARINTRINLSENAALMGWDILCLGLPAQKKRFESGSLVSAFNIFRKGCPIFKDRLTIENPCDLDDIAGLRTNPVTASFWAAPVTESQFNQIRKETTIDDPFFGMTLLDDILVARFLGKMPCKAREIFLQLHEKLRPMITGKNSHMPRIWNT